MITQNPESSVYGTPFRSAIQRFTTSPHSKSPNQIEKSEIRVEQLREKQRLDQKLTVEVFDITTKYVGQQDQQKLQKLKDHVKVFCQEVDSNNHLVIIKFYDLPYQLLGYTPADLSFVTPSGFVMTNGITVKPIANRSYRNTDSFSLEQYFMFTGTREGEYQLKDAVFRKSLQHQLNPQISIDLTLMIYKSGSFSQIQASK